MSLASSDAAENVTGFAAVDPSKSSPAVGHPSVPGDGGTEHAGSVPGNGGVWACDVKGAVAMPRRTAVAKAASRRVEDPRERWFRCISPLLLR
jgi:hypothetical protein